MRALLDPEARPRAFTTLPVLPLAEADECRDDEADDERADDDGGSEEELGGQAGVHDGGGSKRLA